MVNSFRHNELHKKNQNKAMCNPFLISRSHWTVVSESIWLVCGQCTPLAGFEKSKWLFDRIESNKNEHIHCAVRGDGAGKSWIDESKNGGK